MKSFTPSIPTDLSQAVAVAKTARAEGQRVAFAGGGSDLFALMKDRVVTPDVLVYLKNIKALDTVAAATGGTESRWTDHTDRAQQARSDSPAVSRVGGGCRNCRDAANPKRGHARWQRLSAAMVLVLSQWLSPA
jgi:CO/xanthine dehydrogenase FAD-binding subunit